MVTIGTVITAAAFPSQAEGCLCSPPITPSTEIPYLLRCGSNVGFAAEGLKHLFSACSLEISEVLTPGKAVPLHHQASCKMGQDSLKQPEEKKTIQIPTFFFFYF